MNFRPRPVGNEWIRQLREDDSDVITIARRPVLDGGRARRFDDARFPPPARTAPVPPRPAITAQVQISTDGVDRRCQ
jgi:hypothetical protein